VSQKFNGHGQERGGVAIGPVGQRELVRLLKTIIDASRAKSGSRTRDEARAALRALLAEAHWNTPYCRRNLGARRCRYLLGLGYPVSIADASRNEIERLEEWARRNER
jgi:hypothetical protein